MRRETSIAIRRGSDPLFLLLLLLLLANRMAAICIRVAAGASINGRRPKVKSICRGRTGTTTARKHMQETEVVQ